MDTLHAMLNNLDMKQSWRIAETLPAGLNAAGSDSIAITLPGTHLEIFWLLIPQRWHNLPINVKLGAVIDAGNDNQKQK